MTRWEPNARERLERAALELFADQGFAQTTVPEIATRAGLTTRTYFRHFADKREVLFAGDSEIPALAARMIAAAPPELSPLDLIAAGLDQVAAARFSGSIEPFLARRAVIDSDEGLREREMRKMDALADAIRTGFEKRGSDPLTATLVAHITTTVFSVSIGQWLDEAGRTPLPDLLRSTLEALKGILS